MCAHHSRAQAEGYQWPSFLRLSLPCGVPTCRQRAQDWRVLSPSSEAPLCFVGVCAHHTGRAQDWSAATPGASCETSTQHQQLRGINLECQGLLQPGSVEPACSYCVPGTRRLCSQVVWHLHDFPAWSCHCKTCFLISLASE